MTAGVRRPAAARACCSITTSRRPVSLRRTTPDCSGSRRSAGASLPRSSGHVDLALGDSEFNRRNSRRLGFTRTGVLPIAVNTERDHGRAEAPGAGKDSRRRPRQRPLRRPDRSQQADRGSHPARRDVQALHRQLLSLHLRRPLRRHPAVLRTDPGAHCRIRHAAGPLLVYWRRPGRRPGACTIAGPTSTSRSASTRGSACRWSKRWRRTCRSSPTRRGGAGDTGGAGVLFAPKDLEFAAEMVGMLVYDRPVRDRVIEGQRRRCAISPRPGCTPG